MCRTRSSAGSGAGGCERLQRRRPGSPVVPRRCPLLELEHRCLRPLAGLAVDSARVEKAEIGEPLLQRSRLPVVGPVEPVAGAPGGGRVGWRSFAVNGRDVGQPGKSPSGSPPFTRLRRARTPGSAVNESTTCVIAFRGVGIRPEGEFPPRSTVMRPPCWGTDGAASRRGSRSRRTATLGCCRPFEKRGGDSVCARARPGKENELLALEERDLDRRAADAAARPPERAAWTSEQATDRMTRETDG